MHKAVTEARAQTRASVRLKLTCSSKPTTPSRDQETKSLLAESRTRRELPASMSSSRVCARYTPRCSYHNTAVGLSLRNRQHVASEQ